MVDIDTQTLGGVLIVSNDFVASRQIRDALIAGSMKR